MNLIINNKPVSLIENDGKIWATSLQVADVFEKQHKNVLRAIENLPDDEFRQLNFQPSSEVRKNGFFDKETKFIPTPKGLIERFTPMITAKGQIALSAKIIQAFKGGNNENIRA